MGAKSSKKLFSAVHHALNIIYEGICLQVRSHGQAKYRLIDTAV